MAASKSTGLQISMGIVVALMLISWIAMGMMYGDLTESRNNEKSKEEEASTANNNWKLLDERVTGLKAELGFAEIPELGDGEADTGTTVRKSLLTALRTLGAAHAQPSAQSPTVAATLQTMRTALDSANAELLASKQGMVDLNARLVAAQAEYRNELQKTQESQTDSETRRQQLVTSQDEMLGKKDMEIAKLREDVRTLDVEKSNLAEELNNVRQAKDEEIALLVQRVDFLREQIDKIEKPSFERPDGAIVRVDNTPPGIVYINLGSDDGLRTGITFSVYSQSHQGVGRRLSDIKGKIQVIEVKNANLAVCLILEQFNDRPMHAGDPIYTPLWSAGMKECFSFVGIIDLDGDGVSDRELLHDILNHNGALIEVEVNDDGELNREDARLTVNTKFLVEGETPDPAQFAGFDPKYEKAKLVQERLKELTDRARLLGIRTVPLRDFLSYIGYKPQQSPWRPGENKLLPTRQPSASE